MSITTTIATLDNAILFFLSGTVTITVVVITIWTVGWSADTIIFTEVTFICTIIKMVTNVVKRTIIIGAGFVIITV